MGTASWCVCGWSADGGYLAGLPKSMVLLCLLRTLMPVFLSERWRLLPAVLMISRLKFAASLKVYRLGCAAASWQGSTWPCVWS
jgi:hypothetical protein